MSALAIDGVGLGSRLFLGTGGLPRVSLLGPVLEAAEPALVTVSMRRASSLADGGLLAEPAGARRTAAAEHGRMSLRARGRAHRGARSRGARHALGQLWR
ncbi:hypothetical protein [Nocardioides convexus]|uniref:hypothetical protein n=1 Tax=Nocardioides convexus TaxID=2712224 RepID=UPI00241821DB|nr:hypothetical protein [Nocardioides convexus]